MHMELNKTTKINVLKVGHQTNKICTNKPLVTHDLAKHDNHIVE